MKTWFSKNINNFHGYQRRIGTDPFKHLATLYGEFDSVFEVGCGSAVWYENHKAFGKKGDYKGTDITDEFVEASKLDYPEVKWEVQDASHLTEKDNSWDIVLGIHFLEYTYGYKDPIAEMLRVAKKRVIIVMWREIGDRNGVETFTHPDISEFIGEQYYDINNFSKYLRILPCKIVEENKNVPDGRVPNLFWVLDKI